MKRFAAAICASTAITALVGCSLMSRDLPEPPPEPTLTKLQPARMPDTEIELPNIDLAELTARYREVLATTTDAEVKVQVLHRLAGLEMLRGEEALDQQPGVASVFDIAIEAYTELLEQHPERPGNDRLMYQLSKAYDLNGQSEESLKVLTELVNDNPDSQHFAEAQFRRAEIFFAAGDYSRAEQAYAEVIEQGGHTSYYQNALYMHGWSQFKRGRYRASLKSFSETLDGVVPENNDLERLSRGERELANDSLRVMSVVFSYLDGAQTIKQVYSKLGQRHYEPLLYDNLGALYLKQERFRDSAEAYRTFVDLYPDADEGPGFYGKLINAFEQGDFPNEVLAEKEHYVKKYGIDSDYWDNRYLWVREEIRPLLKQYLSELARHYHASAQRLKTQKVKKASQRQANLEQAKEQFMRAGDYYAAYIETVPDDEKVAEMTFLMAETRFEAEAYLAAIEAYESAAYDFLGDEGVDDKRAAEAGYSAILSYNKYLQRLEPPEQTGWQQKKIDSELRFADQFRTDPRATTVLAKAAQELLELEQYRRALAAARDLVEWQPAAQADLRKTAWLVVGHSEFELRGYAEAEQAYQQTLALIPNTPSNADERKDLIERLAASVYKQGEEELARGNKLAAADQFLRVAQVAPTSAIRINAQYDAASNLLAAKEWGRAVDVLQDFRRRYPANPLAAEVPTKLIFAYEESGNWAQAAQEYLVVHAAETEPKAKAEALFVAAELFEKAGDTEAAIVHYRDYAHGYPEPFSMVMEARYRLSEIYRTAGEDWKRRFWLKKMIAGDADAGEQRNERSRYLAAMSSSVLADDAYQAFTKIKLTLPLKKSLNKKRKALDKALAAYQKTADYGVQEFATQASYRIGEIYASLSRDLMASQRPKNLDALALEQYDVLLEEQAYPFEEKSIEIHEANIARSYNGIYDDWIKQSFSALAVLLPARYAKQETGVSINEDIY